MAKRITLERLIAKNLKTFLANRTDRFSNVTTEQKSKWAKNVVKMVKGQLADHDLFYENVPVGVKEIKGA